MPYSPREEDINDYRREAAEDLDKQRRRACQCGDDMPGVCPGADSCPMVFCLELEGGGVIADYATGYRADLAELAKTHDIIRTR